MINECLPGQPAVDGVVREHEVMEAGGDAEKKAWRIDDERQNETPQGHKSETERRGLHERGWNAGSRVSGGLTSGPVGTS